MVTKCPECDSVMHYFNDYLWFCHKCNKYYKKVLIPSSDNRHGWRKIWMVEHGKHIEHTFIKTGDKLIVKTG